MSMFANATDSTKVSEPITQILIPENWAKDHVNDLASFVLEWKHKAMLMVDEGHAAEAFVVHVIMARFMDRFSEGLFNVKEAVANLSQVDSRERHA